MVAYVRDVATGEIAVMSGDAMSSHREAPEISKDPVAGPNFYEFGDDVLYRINTSNSGEAEADVTYSFRFTTEVLNPETFLYNTGPITSLDDENFNRRQFSSVSRSGGRHGRGRRRDAGLPRPGRDGLARRSVSTSWSGTRCGTVATGRCTPRSPRAPTRLWHADGRRAGTVRVAAGRVTETTWAAVLDGP